MALTLNSIDPLQPFKQGEILIGDDSVKFNELTFESGPLIESANESSDPAIGQKIHHRRILLVSPDCDLEQDFKARVAKLEGFEDVFRSQNERYSFRDKGKACELSNVLVCPLWSEDKFKFRVSSGVFSQVLKSNSHQRWCSIGPMLWSDRSNSSDETKLFLDCGYIFTWPMQLVHEQLRESN